ETVEHLKELGNPIGDDYGNFFLSKIVQISVGIPPPGKEVVEQLLDGFMTPRPQNGTGRPSPHSVDDHPDDSDPPSREEQEETRQKEEATQLREASALLASDSEDVRNAAASVLPMLSQNPREVKRFYNAFRLQLLVAYLMLGREVLSPDWLKILAKWVALRLHRPRLAEDLDREDWLLGALETYANGDHVLPDTPLANRYKRWFEDEDLRKALKGTSGERLAPYFKKFLNAFSRVA
ncbi:MAG: hypothetical protein IIB15_07770, partial [Chloroflexi bacterium]|nr:hypothetical protein [Chloroflexota bacterium]